MLIYDFSKFSVNSTFFMVKQKASEHTSHFIGGDYRFSWTSSTSDELPAGVVSLSVLFTRFFKNPISQHKTILPEGAHSSSRDPPTPRIM